MLILSTKILMLKPCQDLLSSSRAEHHTSDDVTVLFGPDYMKKYSSPARSGADVQGTFGLCLHGISPHLRDNFTTCGKLYHQQYAIQKPFITLNKDKKLVRRKLSMQVIPHICFEFWFFMIHIFRYRFCTV